MNSKLSLFGGRSGTSHIYAVVAVSQFVCVFGLKPVHSGSSIKLSSEDFISLDETVEFGRQVSILALQAVRVLF